MTTVTIFGADDMVVLGYFALFIAQITVHFFCVRLSFWKGHLGLHSRQHINFTYGISVLLQPLNPVRLIHDRSSCGVKMVPELSPSSGFSETSFSSGVKCFVSRR